MDSTLDDIVYRMRLTKLESKLALREIEHDSLKREIALHRITPDRHVAARERCDELQSECAQLLIELDQLRHSREH
jgi:hypothetical protein